MLQCLHILEDNILFVVPHFSQSLLDLELLTQFVIGFLQVFGLFSEMLDFFFEGCCFGLLFYLAIESVEHLECWSSFEVICIIFVGFDCAKRFDVLGLLFVTIFLLVCLVHLILNL